MNDHLIGIQISQFRKAAGLTQEELGEAVGISGQAVSRWECGGAPDVALLRYLRFIGHCLQRCLRQR